MNSWCESCARKNCCYTMEIRPKCYLPTTNTAHGTPETYLAKTLRYSRESHEIAEQTENCSEKPNNCEWCKFFDGENCYSQEPCKAKYEPQTDDKDINVRSKDEPQLVKESTEVVKDLVKDEPQTERSSK